MEKTLLLWVLLSVLVQVSIQEGYYFGFFSNTDNTAIPSVIISTLESQPVNYVIEAPGVGYNTSGNVTSDNEVIIILPTTLITSSRDDQDKGIHLMISSDKVTVIGQNLRNVRSDTFLCLPITNYCIVDKYLYYGLSVRRSSRNPQLNSSILVVGTENSTMMKLTATQPITINVSDSTVDLTAGVQYSFVINRLQTVLIESLDDLTGTKIVTDKPVSVLSGHECAFVGGVQACDHLIEQLPPTILWGRVYYTAPLATRRSYTIKVLAAFNSTVVDIYCNNTRESYNIGEGNSVSKVLSLQEYCVVNSSEQVLVVQLSHGGNDDTVNGDPMMTLVPSTNQFGNIFQFSTLQGQSGFTHYINIIVLSQYYQPDMIYLISGGVNRSLDTHQWVPIMVNEAYSVQVMVSEGVVEVVHQDTNARLSVIVYGFTFANGYGHSGGYNTIGTIADLMPVTEFMVVTTRNSAFVMASPPPNITNVEVVGYIVSYQIVGSNDVKTIYFTTEDTLLNDEIQSLLPFTNYTFSVRACCDGQCTPDSDSITQMTLEDVGSVHCQMEQDSTWSITWPATLPGEEAMQQCQGNGGAYRKCLQNVQWGEPDVSECRTPEVVQLEMEAESLLTVDGDVGESVTSETVIDITDELSSILNTSQPIFPNDLSSITNILDVVILVTVQLNTEEGNDSLVQEVTEDITEVLDILFDEENDVSFEQTRNEDRVEIMTTPGERLQDISEQTGRLLSTTLDFSTNETVGTSVVGSRNNIAIEVVIPTEENLMMMENIPLPNATSSAFGKRSPMFQVPSAVIMNQMQKEGRRVPIISIIARNSHLPTNIGVRVESLILSIQISSDEQPRTSLGNETVSITFYIGNVGNSSRFNTRCAFFELSSTTNQSGRFSTDGIIQSDTTNNTFVQCSTTHLTSFAVLVDVSGRNTGTEALSIASYIGCAISIACLTIAVITFFALRKNVFNMVQHFVHINLSIALLMGLLTFVSGIEAASEYRASCLIVAILLHYFFMAAFSWMLCEGILLFVTLQYVLYKGFFKSQKFFFLIGWGLPIPIVAISAAVSHEQYGINDRCWISEEKGAIWAFIAPMLLIITVNFFFLAVIIYKVYVSKSNKDKAIQGKKLDIAKAMIMAAIFVTPILGLTWLFGLLVINEQTVVFAWIFLVFNSLQGFFILCFYVLRNKKFQNAISAACSKRDSHLSPSYKIANQNEMHCRMRTLDTEESNKTATDTAEDVSSNTCEHSPNYSTADTTNIAGNCKSAELCYTKTVSSGQEDSTQFFKNHQEAKPDKTE
ncbi:latrophilin-like protein LAT-2 isoform X3 [Dysidea avara]|uniref:latrophilin-like protein LAT-2 isoform X3 n=1 Tax=Dysidea avara TaxID=196820 RepID=UPI003326D596